jgi:hypothetical protein
MKSNTHEDFFRSHETKGSSDRTFGLVLGCFFGLIGLLPLRSGGRIRAWAVLISVAFFIAALVRPSVLHSLNRLWTRLGMLLGKIVNPVVTGLLFYLLFTPVGFLFRLWGKDSLHLKFDATSQSYWNERRPPGPSPDTMANQF